MGLVEKGGKLLRRLVITLAATVVVGANVVAATAVAEPAAPLAGSDVQARSDLDKLVRNTPGARRVDATTVELPSRGVVIKWNSPGTAKSVLGSCSFKFLCVFDQENFVGWEADFSQCIFDNLFTLPFPAGGDWHDKASSFINQQTTGTKVRWYNLSSDGSVWELWWVTGGAFETAASLGSGFNNFFDAVRPC